MSKLIMIKQTLITLALVSTSALATCPITHPVKEEFGCATMARATIDTYYSAEFEHLSNAYDRELHRIDAYELDFWEFCAFERGEDDTLCKLIATN